MSSISTSYVVQLNASGNLVSAIDGLSVRFPQLNKAVNKVKNSLGGLTVNMLAFNQMTDGLRNISEGLLSLSQSGLDFEQSMADLSSITGIVGNDLHLLESKAREFGKTSGLGAVQAARSYAVLASQIQVDKIGMEGLNELQEKTIVLSKAAGISMDEAAISLAGTINQFGLSAQEAARVINVLAAGSKYGAAEIPDLALSFKVVGAAANAAGLSVEQTAAAIEVLSKNNLKGAEAGTALRNIVLKLQTVLGYDFSKVGLSQALAELSPRLKDASYLSKIFGMENVAAAQFLITNSSAVDEMTAAVTNTNVAYEQAQIRQNTYAETLARIKATVEDFKISIFGSTGALLPWCQAITETLTPLALLAPAVPLVAKGFSLLKIELLKFGPAAKVFSGSAAIMRLAMVRLRTGIISLGTAFKISCKAIGSAIKSIPFLGWAAIAVGAIISVISAIRRFKESSAAAAKERKESLQQAAQSAGAYYAQERMQLDNIFRALEKTNPKSKERNRLVDELSRLYPSMNTQLREELKNTTDLNAAKEKMIDLLMRQAAVEGAKSVLQDEYKKATELYIVKAAEDKDNEEIMQKAGITKDVYERLGRIKIVEMFYSHEGIPIPGTGKDLEDLAREDDKKYIDAYRKARRRIKDSANREYKRQADKLSKTEEDVKSLLVNTEVNEDEAVAVAVDTTVSASTVTDVISGGGRQSKNFYINIGSLIGVNNNSFSSSSDNPETASDFMQKLTDALQTVLNDINYSAG